MEPRFKWAEGKVGRLIAARLLPGTDVMIGIEKICREAGIRYGVVGCAIGSLEKTTFQILLPKEEVKIGAAYGEPITLGGPIEILGIRGVIFESEDGGIALHFHATLCDKDGKAMGGHLVYGENPVLATLDVVIQEIEGVRISREYDPETELSMFSPQIL